MFPNAMLENPEDVEHDPRHDDQGPRRPRLELVGGQHRSAARRRASLSAWLIVPCLAADGLMVPVLSSLQGPPRELPAAIAFGIVGCVLAQGCVLAAWLAWSDGPFPQRLARHWLIASGLYAVWLVGLALAIPRDIEVPQIAATVALGIPLVSLAAQFPPWVWRHLWGWRLLNDNANPAPTCEQRFTIRDLMVATLVVAASLALARLAAPADGHSVWPIWAFACTVAGIVSTISLLPAGVFLLSPRPLRRGLFWSAIYAASWISLVWIVVAAQWWFAPQTLIPRRPLRRPLQPHAHLRRHAHPRRHHRQAPRLPAQPATGSPLPRGEGQAERDSSSFVTVK